MLDFQDFLRGVLLPGFITGIALVLVWRPWRRTPDERARPGRSWTALLSAIAFFASYTALFGLPPHPFGARVLGGVDWLLWIALAAGVVLFFDSTLGRLALPARTLLVVGMLFAVLRAMLRYHWSTGEAATWLPGLALLLALLWFATAGLVRRAPGATVPVVLLLAATGLALCSGLSGSAKLAQMVGAVCACLGAATIVALWHRGSLLNAGDSGWCVLVLFGLGLCAHFFSELAGIDALLLCVAPLAAWAGELPSLRARSPLQRMLLRFLAVLVPVGIAVTRAILGFEPDPYGDYYDD